VAAFLTDLRLFRACRASTPTTRDCKETPRLRQQDSIDQSPNDWRKERQRAAANRCSSQQTLPEKSISDSLIDYLNLQTSQISSHHSQPNRKANASQQPGGRNKGHQADRKAALANHAPPSDCDASDHDAN
jgi:hypothetical protein